MTLSHIPSDAECITACLNGNTHSFRLLLARYQQPLLAFIRGRIPPHESPDEHAQETFVRAYTHLRHLSKHDSFFPWLLGIADRVTRESRRHAARDRTALANLARKSPAQLTLVQPPDDGADPELDHAVAALPDPYRQVVLLRYHGNLTCAQIADRLALPLGSITKILSRAYAMLRQTLTPLAQPERTGTHDL